MQTKLVQFSTPDHLTLPGILYEPATKTKRAIISIHGNGSSSVFYHQNENHRFAQVFTQAGLTFFPFNNRGAHFIKSLHRKEERVLYGMSYELVKEGGLDIEGAITWLKSLGYEEFYLLGFSTGATKIALYDYYKKHNEVKGYILAGGGDDVGMHYTDWGEKLFQKALEESKAQVAAGRGRQLAPLALTQGEVFSYQSLYDILNPNGDYNIFPFHEMLTGTKLSTKPLLQELQAISKPCLLVYGANDEYCYGQVAKIVDLLQAHTAKQKNLTYQVIADTDHQFEGKEKVLAQQITNWIENYADVKE